MDKCCAIIVAAGAGSRFGGVMPKQFLQLGGFPVLSHSLLAFEKKDCIAEIILVVSADYLEQAAKLSTPKVSNIIAGSNCRQQSVYNALQLLENKGFDGIILVHDGARPFVDSAVLDAVIAAAKEYAAATVATPVTDTIKLATEGIIDKTLPKEQLFAVQTPQAFRAEILYKAHKSARGLDGYDDCQLVEKIGISPKIVPGSPLNMKITHANDLEIAENILKNKEM